VSLVLSGLLKGLSDLQAMQCLWGFKYTVTQTGDSWTAVKRADPRVCFEAMSAEALHFKIRDDYYGRTRPPDKNS
jgi:hypothetical protein